jgi:hypothetical protein
LDQWNHVDVLDAKEIMDRIRLHMIKFNKLGGLKQNSKITSTSMHKVRNTMKQMNSRKGTLKFIV